MNWEKKEIEIENGDFVNAQAPVIISASRSTDIPAFYSDWFFYRLKKGYLKWNNPFNGVPLYVSFKNVRLIVFWSKNPKPMLSQLEYLNQNNINYYFQYTLNDYTKNAFEKRVGSVNKRIETFIELSEKIGKDKVIWRFDPYILTDEINPEELLRRTEYIGNRLKGYTTKMVFSFADITKYKKVRNNLSRYDIRYRDFDRDTMNEIAYGLKQLNKTWDIEIATCSEKIDLNKYGIAHNKCIDDDLIIKLFSSDTQLMDFLGVKIEKQLNLFSTTPTISKTKNIKDKGQREDCGCIVSKDIGQYNTCPHQCVYCYANTSFDIANRNYIHHKNNIKGETIVAK